ncbi:hypothetical protein M409DRAFT_59336 [Zasmidium cellare ATCC 36951]|uniref:WSC domain-containing protein n=1 Tax=Zasmidium cellare ATCC 36951 TaxID=1080233 RepID=A0A6A6C1W9_ZASCE|nr:uncharacterized protein M409DRAFT_59336 [Zasmidium cellare ATCC 36951]KAF2161054.1 hypothetical protein M409DRAFT_59336 [Zasmidium cellare ATCC 36951]
MKFVLATAGLSLSLTSAFHIPEGIQDGVYSVHVYPNGTEEHNRLPNPSPLGSALQLRKRQGEFYGGPQCYGGDEGGELNHGDTDAANAALQNQCGYGANINYGDDFYSIYGCTVAYACNFYDNSNAPAGANDDYTTCFADCSVHANQIITSGCGEYQPGSIQDNLYEVAYGYENFCSSRGSNFCGRGTG